MGIDFDRTECMDIDEILELLDRERRLAGKVRKENEELQSENKTICSRNVKKTSEVHLEDDKCDTVVEKKYDFEKEFKTYLEDFNRLEEYTKESIESILPARSNYNYEKIIMRLIAEVSRQIKDDNELFSAFGDDMDKDELNEYRNNVISKKSTRLILKNILFAKTEEKQVEDKNKLIFVPIKSTGKIRIFDEIKDIPEEEYEGFVELLESIKNGTFKGFRKFVNNEFLTGLLEVRGHQVRVAFERISEDCYAVVSMFMKKTQNDNSYRKTLQAKYAEYKTMEKEIKEKLKDPNYLKKNKEYDEEVFKILIKTDEKGDHK